MKGNPDGDGNPRVDESKSKNRPTTEDLTESQKRLDPSSYGSLLKYHGLA